MSKYSDEDKARLIAHALDQISQGELVATACKSLGFSRETLHAWTKDDPALSDAYARAREMQSHALAEQALTIANGEDEGTERRVAQMVEAVHGAEEADKAAVINALVRESVQRDRLRVDTIKWFTSKIAPKLYGEKLEVSGPDGGPIRVVYSKE